MGKRTEYAPGVFCWADLVTSDVDAAKSFYDALFGWEYDDRDVGDGAVYALANVDGRVAAAITSVPDDAPPRWTSYIAVESVDDVAAAAKGAGAAIVADPVDAGPAGRVAVLQDPSGAVVAIWQAGERAGADVVNEPGALCWNDLVTHDVEKAVAFYGDVFPWEIGAVEDAPGDRHGIRVGETLNGGMARFPESVGEGAPPHWLACFAVDDVEASMQAVESGGGSAVSPVVDVPTGRFAVVADPQGAVFGIVDGDMDP